MDDLIRSAIIIFTVFFIAVGFIIAFISSVILTVLSIVDEHGQYLKLQENVDIFSYEKAFLCLVLRLQR